MPKCDANVFIYFLTRFFGKNGGKGDSSRLKKKNGKKIRGKEFLRENKGEGQGVR